MEDRTEKNGNYINEEMNSIKTSKFSPHFFNISVFGWIIILMFFTLCANIYCN